MQNKFLLSILLLFITISINAQTINIQTQSSTDKFSISQLDSITFTLKGSLAKYSLNIHTAKGITQVKLSDLDSLTVSGNKFLNIRKKTELTQFLLSDIDSLTFCSISIPNRMADAISGTKFIQSIQSMAITEREPLILQEFRKGNIPDFYRNMCRITTKQNDSLGILHDVTFEVMPDYLAIGTSEDFYRIPMGPQTAQSIADLYGCCLPTRKMVNIIYTATTVRLEPITYAPVGNNNELVTMFIRHNQDIESKRLPMGSKLGSLIGGLKKDVIITNLLPSKPTSVVIYGWHKLDGSAIQPLYTGHIKTYVDYSHGIRLVNSVMWVDGKETTIQKVLADPVLYKLLSDEVGIMTQPRYL